MSYRTLLQESYQLSDDVLMIQTEQVESFTLEEWLKENQLKRMKITVINFFEKVCIINFVIAITQLQACTSLQILDAISYVSQFSHQSLNLKPSNIFLDPNKDDFLKIGDIGLVTGYNSSERLITVTVSVYTIESQEQYDIA